MKVLHISSTLSSGGAEQHLLTLCQGLRARNVDVTVAFLRENVRGSASLRDKFESCGIETVPLRAESRWKFGYIPAAMKLIARWKPAIVHTHLPKADLAGYSGRLTAARGTKWVVSLHDRYDKNWSAKRVVPLLRPMWRAADRVIAISNPVRHWALNSLNVNNGKLGVIEYGINAERWPEHQRMATSSSGAVIGSMGRLEQRKGHQFLIQAMPQILRYDAGAKLIIAGHDTWGYGEELRLEARRVGVLDHVHFAGYQEARTFFPQLDVFAFASLSEGFGQVLIEAMACSIPCVATDAPPLSTILQNGLSGLLARPADPKSFAEAIVRLLADRPLRGALGAAARQRVMENYSAARMTAETFGLYQTLLQ